MPRNLPSDHLPTEVLKVGAVSDGESSPKAAVIGPGTFNRTDR
jgi:hypothetical protein